MVLNHCLEVLTARASGGKQGFVDSVAAEGVALRIRDLLTGRMLDEN